LVKASHNGATTVCGGGDTISLVNMVQGASQALSHLSTGGGASLELVEGKTLPGIEYLSEESELKNYH
jgi:phosphoglycerate kinase